MFFFALSSVDFLGIGGDEGVSGFLSLLSSGEGNGSDSPNSTDCGATTAGVISPNNGTGAMGGSSLITNFRSG